MLGKGLADPPSRSEPPTEPPTASRQGRSGPKIRGGERSSCRESRRWGRGFSHPGGRVCVSGEQTGSRSQRGPVSPPTALVFLAVRACLSLGKRVCGHLCAEPRFAIKSQRAAGTLASCAGIDALLIECNPRKSPEEHEIQPPSPGIREGLFRGSGIEGREGDCLRGREEGLGPQGTSR